ncbi:MAG: FAD-linked oxidase C-terminal domain-containing protein, partial [Planctomycetota bacterium]
MIQQPRQLDSAKVAAFQHQIANTIRGGHHFDDVTLGIYSTDASHYQVIPCCVVTPLDEQDAVAAVKLAGQHGIPITARGGGTSLSGQTTWNGLVLDFSKHMNGLIEFHENERWARVQPGIVRDELNSKLADARLHFAPDPATGNRAAVGGLIGNNSSGTRSVVYGKTIDNVMECRVVLADGTIMDLAQTGPDQWQAIEAKGDRQSEIYRGVRELMDRERDEIDRRFPKVMRRVGGYNLDAFLPHDRGGHPGEWNLSNLIVGSEGTLAVLLQAKIKLTPLPNATALCVVHFDDVLDSLRAVDPILEHKPSTVELLDHHVIVEAKRNPTTSALMDFIEGEPQAIQIVELFGDSPEHARQRANELADSLRSQGIGTAWPIRDDAAGKKRVWDVRKLGLGLLANAKGARKAQAFIEDACVPTNVLAEYIQYVFDVCEKHGVPIGVYAHASVGVIHCRPRLDMHSPEDVELMQKIAWECYQKVKEYGGSWSGEHGDGLVRGEFVPDFFGEQIYAAFRELKGLFDPQGLMNPGKIVDSPPMTENLRFGPHYRPEGMKTTFNYRDQGSFELAVEQCAGVGACRKTGGGTMCPSYMATRDEAHSTRGRANALRMAMSGQLGPSGMTDDGLDDVLKLCLACKACKTECPTAVDMSRLKSEVLQMRHDKSGISQAAKMLGRMPNTVTRLAGPLAGLANWVQNLSPVRAMLEKVAGIDRRRPLPKIVSKPFSKMATDLVSSSKGDGKLGPVALFIDTVTNCYEPEVGVAATRLLQDCGYDVQPLTVGCCQRPQISRGLLREAKKAGLATLQQLDAYASLGTPILVLEPSCASALVDDLPDLIDETELGERISKSIHMIDVFPAFFRQE